MKQKEVNPAVLIIMSMANITVTMCLDGKIYFIILDKWSCVIPASKGRFYVLALSIPISETHRHTHSNVLQLKAR